MKYLVVVILCIFLISCKEEEVQDGTLVSLNIALVNEQGEDFFLNNEHYFIDSIRKVDAVIDVNLKVIVTKTVNGIQFAVFSLHQFEESYLDYGNGDIDTFQLVGDGKYTFVNDLYTSSSIDLYFNGEKQIRWDLPKGEAIYYYDGGRKEQKRKARDLITWPHHDIIFLKDSSSLDLPRR